MAQQPPAFVVVDKRKFTADGAIREGFVPPEPETPTPPPPATEPEMSSAKIVTMPARTPEATEDATSGADDLREEDMAGALEATGTDMYNIAEDGPDADLPDTGEEDPIGQPRSAAETAAQALAYKQSSQEIDAMLQQANPGMQQPGAVTFDHVIQSFYLSAIMAMGAGAEPGQKPRVDILGARQSIDMLAILEEKTRGRLSAQEKQLLQGITFELRMMFLELTNAISRQAQQAPPAPLGRPQPGRVPPGGGLR